MRKTCAKPGAFKEKILPTGEQWPDILGGECKIKRPIDWLISECVHGQDGKGRSQLPADWRMINNYRLVPNIVKTGHEMTIFIKTSSPNLSGLD